MSTQEKQITIKISADVHQEFKKLCIDEGKSMKDYVGELIERELAIKKNNAEG